MEFEVKWFFTFFVIAINVALYSLIRRTNELIYLKRLGAMKDAVPPGDMGWPFLGNMWSFFSAFKYGDPDSFISYFTTRFGRAPMYRALLFGKPSIIVTTAETCRKVLTDERFGPGWPKSVSALVGKKGLHGVSVQEHRRLRKLIASPIAGQEALSSFLEYIKEIAETSFETWAKNDGTIEFLTEMRKTAFKAMMNIIMSNEIDEKSLDYMEREYTLFSHGLKSMAINLPGFAYYKALKARKKLVKAFQKVVSKRRMMPTGDEATRKKDMLALMMEISDDYGSKLTDEEIIDLLIIYLLAGHESTGHAVTWVIILLEEHPQYLQKAKEEQEEIVKRRELPESGLNLGEIKEMKYLQKVNSSLVTNVPYWLPIENNALFILKVIDETLRFINLSFVLFREAKTDVNINGYLIPKGWKVLPWIRNVHIDHENFQNPYDFNPSRWEDHKNKLGTFAPFGAGRRLCPGADLAKLEVSVFLHYFLLNYRLERVNPKSKVQHLPITRPADKCLAKIMKLTKCL